MYFILHVLATITGIKNGSLLLYYVSLEDHIKDLKILPFVTFDYIMRWCINNRYFKSVSYGYRMIRLKEILLGRWVNSDLIDMRAKANLILVLHLSLVFTGRDHITWIDLIWFRIFVIVRMDWGWNSWGIELYSVMCY